MANNYSKLLKYVDVCANEFKNSKTFNWISVYQIFFVILYLIKQDDTSPLIEKIKKDKKDYDELIKTKKLINLHLRNPAYVINAFYDKIKNFECDLASYLAYKKILFALQTKFSEQVKTLTLPDLVLGFFEADNSIIKSYILDKTIKQTTDPKPIMTASEMKSVDKILLDKYTSDFLNEESQINFVDKASASSKKTSPTISLSAKPVKKSSKSVEKDATTSSKINDSFLTKLVNETKNMQKVLRKEIFGQDYAIQSFITGYFRSELLATTNKNKSKPRATFLFAGAPGVGKTFLAESVAEVLKLPYKRFDMSEYADKEANLEFCGSDKVYKNGKAGNVTEFVEKNPHCVLLFDEVEKCHQVVTYLFLQMLDAGRLRDNYTDNEVSFADAIIIFTTNAGKQLYENSDFADLSSVSRKVVLQALEEDINPVTQAPLFPRAICSRFASGNVVVFNNLKTVDLIKIVKNELDKNALSFKKEFKTDIQIDNDVSSILLFAEGDKVDARSMKARASAFFNDEIYELLRLITNESSDEDLINKLKSVKIKASFDNTNKEVKELFIDNEAPIVLVCASSELFNKLCTDKKIQFIRVDTCKQAEEILDNKRVSLVLTDVLFGENKGEELLNIEDCLTEGRSLIDLVNREYDVPVYLLENDMRSITDDEIFSFNKLGIYGVFSKTKAENKQSIKTLYEECLECYRQKSLQNLSKQNKVLTYATMQYLSEDKTSATIELFDFNTKTAIEAKDSSKLLCSTEMPNVTFDDIIGANDAKEELKYFIEYLKKPAQFISKGVKQPKGVLLYGPPGTGKTMLAKAMAKEAGVTFIAAEGNEFIKRYSGEGPEKIHEIFRLARKYAPAILFIDEIDVIAKSRESVESTSSDVLTALLTELDGFKENKKPIFLLAATNYSINSPNKSLDGAIIRRFDRSINVDLPSRSERVEYLTKKLATNKLFKVSENQIDSIAQRAVGMSLSELEMVVEMALRNAIRTNLDIISDETFEEAFESYNSGEVKKWDIKTLERTARHEAGHALCCYLSGEMPSYVTIVSRGEYGGYMQHANEEDKLGYTKKELLGKIATCLGGRASEIVYYGKEDGLTTGAAQDLEQATIYAKRIICSYGMNEEFGLGTLYGNEGGEVYVLIRNEINKILSEQLQKAISYIENNKKIIDELVKVLLEKNHLKENEIKQIVEKK